MKKQLIATHITNFPEETIKFGQQLGEVVNNITIALIGDLGAGKTLLSRSICIGAGIDADKISSPTFTLINQYTGGRVLVNHMDTYRLDPDSFIDLGVDEILKGDGIKLIEWAERIEDYLPEDTLFIEIEHAGEFTREFRFLSGVTYWQANLNEILEL